MGFFDYLQLAHVSAVAFIVQGDGSYGAGGGVCRSDGKVHFLHEGAAFLSSDGIAGFVQAGAEGLGKEAGHIFVPGKELG